MLVLSKVVDFLQSTQHVNTDLVSQRQERLEAQAIELTQLHETSKAIVAIATAISDLKDLYQQAANGHTQVLCLTSLQLHMLISFRT